MLTSILAKTFDPPGPSKEPLGLGLDIEKLSSSNRAKSIGAVQLGVKVHEAVGGDGGGGDGGGGEGGGGDGGGGGGDAGGEGQLPGPQLEPWPAEAKAEVPSHAQRMSSLLASDRAFVPCRIERRSVRCGAKCGLGTGGHRPAAAHKRHAREEGPALKAGGGYRECAERTENMPRMSVTLDVSKLSGWLNANVTCRVERRACDVGRGVGRGEA